MKNMQLLAKVDMGQRRSSGVKTAQVITQKNAERKLAGDEAFRLMMKVITMMLITLVAILLASASALKALVTITKMSTRLAKKSALSYLQFS